MSDPAFISQHFTGGVMAGVYALFLIAVWSRPVGRDLRWAITLFAGGGAVSFFGRTWLAMFLPDHPWLDYRILYLLAAAHWAWFLVLAQVLFADEKLRPLHVLPAIALYTLSLVMFIASHAGIGALVRATTNASSVVEAGAILWALVIIARSWRGDLVARRRRLRWIVFTATAGFSLALMLASVADGLGWIDQTWLRALSPWVNVAIALAAANAMLAIRPDIAKPAVADAPSQPGVSEASRLALMRLHAVMGKGEAWRRTGLTMAQLAVETGVSERQLRRLINERLGHTNFAAFLNSYRIEAAKALLADSKAAGRTVAEIATDLGYSSAATFNRAFKDAVGQSPGAWRKSAPAEPPPAVGSNPALPPARTG